MLLLGQLVACRKDNIAPPIDRTLVPRTITQFVENNYDLTLLHAALKKANLLDTLQLPNVGTFFAPDAAAFNAHGIWSEKDLEAMNADSLREVLRGYIIPQRMFISQFPVQMGNVYTTRSGTTMYISVSASGNGAGPDNRNLVINGGVVLDGSKRNISLGNGVVHMLKKMMNVHSGTVQDYLASNPELSIFTAAMKRFNYWEGLKNNNPITVFAPNNAAFEKLNITEQQINNINPAAFKEQLFAIYHFNMAPKRIFTSEGWLIEGTVYADGGVKYGNYSLTPNYGWSAYWGEDSGIELYEWQGVRYGSVVGGNGSTVYKGSNTIDADHVTSNGVVHVIEDLFLFPEAMRK